MFLTDWDESVLYSPGAGLTDVMKLPWSKKEAEPSDRILSCPRCNAPVPKDKPFCDACGARIAPPPSCSLCGTLLEPGSRFCPSCGTMIGKGKEIVSKGKKSGKIPTVPEHSPAASEKNDSVEGKPDDPGEPSPTTMGGEPAKIPAEGAAPDEPAKPVKPVPPQKSRDTIPSGKGRWGLPAGRTPAVIAVVILLLVAGTALIGSGLLTLPRQSSPVTTSVTVATTATPVPTPVNEIAAPTTVPETTAPGIVLDPGPTQTLPAHLNIVLQEERDPRTKMISVEYMGGKGQSGVREIFVRLTRSDGEVLTGSFKPIQVGSRLELQGTEQTDRLEVIVRYYSGEEYTVIDRVFEYKVRTA